MQQINMSQTRKVKERGEKSLSNYLSCVRKEINRFLAKTPRKGLFDPTKKE